MLKKLRPAVTHAHRLINAVDDPWLYRGATDGRHLKPPSGD